MRIPALLVAVLALAGLAPVAGAADRVDEGRALFEQYCITCHALGDGDRVGPDLAGVGERRGEDWLVRFITNPDRMIAEGDPIATRLYERFNRIPMPNFGLTADQAQAIIAFMSATAPAAAEGGPVAYTTPPLTGLQAGMLALYVALTLAVFAVFGWVALSTRAPGEVDVKRAYGLRRVLFGVAVALVLGLLAATLPGVPYAGTDAGIDRIVYVTARQYEFVFSDAPITTVEDLGRVPLTRRLVLDGPGRVEFRVTSLDVNHGFGLYDPERRVLAQTQAMPGYVNRLQADLPVAGEYKVFCLEYCALGHHRMRARVEVR